MLIFPKLMCLPISIHLCLADLQFQKPPSFKDTSNLKMPLFNLNICRKLTTLIINPPTRCNNTGASALQVSSITLSSLLKYGVGKFGQNHFDNIKVKDAIVSIHR